MKKIRLAAMALAVVTIAWAVAISYAYAQIRVFPKTTSARAVLAAGPDDCFISAFEVHPTANESEWQWIYYIKGELAFNETFVGAYMGELTDPLHPYVKEAIENQDYLILFTDEEWTSVPIEQAEHWYSIYKYNGVYYAFWKCDLDGRYVDTMTPEMEWAIRKANELRPPTIGSIATLTACWIGLGVCVVKRKQEYSIES